MKCSSNRGFFLTTEKGFTLVEMIGILAIIAILAAAISPRIFDAISDSKITNLVATIKTLGTNVTKYYSDVGTVLPLDAAGAPVQNAAGTLLPDILTKLNNVVPANPAGLWTKYRGPYLDQFAGSNPPVGTSMTMPAVNVAGVGGNVNANNVTNYDLNGDGISDFPAGSQIVSLQVPGISQKDFQRLDGILDEGIGSTLAEKSARGKVKWQNANGGTLRVYLAHK